MKRGLNRIARQVRSAIRSDQPGADNMVDDMAPVSVDATRTAAIGGRAMDDKELVQSLFPEAEVRSKPNGGWVIVIDQAPDSHRIGEGRSTAEAWASAALRLSRDEWFQPIIAQLLAMRSERRGGA